MRKLLLIVITVCQLSNCFCQDKTDVYVRSYFKKDGTYVPSHYRTRPNDNFYDNYSTLGNINPYTLKLGWKTKDDAYNYYSTIYSGNSSLTSFSELITAINNNDKSTFDRRLNRFTFDKDTRTFFKGVFLSINGFHEEALSNFSQVKQSTKDQFLLKESLDWIEITDAASISEAWREIQSLGLDTIDFYQLYPIVELTSIVNKINSIKNPRNNEFKLLSLFNIYMSNMEYQSAKRILKEINSLERTLNIESPLSLEDFDYVVPLITEFEKARTLGVTDTHFSTFIDAHIYFISEQNKIANNKILHDHQFKLRENKSTSAIYHRELYDYRTTWHSNIMVINQINDFNDSIKVYRTDIILPDDSLYHDFEWNIMENADYIGKGPSLFKNDIENINIDYEFSFKNFPYLIVAKNRYQDNTGGFIIFSVGSTKSMLNIYDTLKEIKPNPYVKQK